MRQKRAAQDAIIIEYWRLNLPYILWFDLSFFRPSAGQKKKMPWPGSRSRMPAPPASATGSAESGNLPSYMWKLYENDSCTARLEGITTRGKTCCRGKGPAASLLLSKVICDFNNFQMRTKKMLWHCHTERLCSLLSTVHSLSLKHTFDPRAAKERAPNGTGI